ncbi:ABC transporter substrate-binding protein [Afifella marina]|uniref:Sorbitol/mannitol transport system substrate-binding protein n=1 Tax=Afifella marina DSM 2698 TaxID=1120955 RepID=A0A1G5MXY8_AFIMA|nr:sugar ABC transporter substrate-binding protein [Afifella marina]MBK1622130.1 sugar ABC transporter substrate-binding protein [Afifella marina DSM 2698]MBK1628256.1 sugar ABC transporter substrate-binding protein [Afifella marina]MBK5918914.1 sugar ABC transporter substrate-binding protein [Afifella marina]RAI17775.1 sugar ABC transporter substrate-binding protein [Afifella marina DSM 2698]SCZ29754.1 sorbitol/mannitol transport system substrate-binding protein [Afifella marina DSM 2698]
MRRSIWAAGAVSVLAFTAAAHAETITIATVNNGDMIRMQKLAEDFTKNHPDIQLEWVTLEENVLRQRVTTDIATKGGQYDVMTIGNYEVPIWAKQDWLVALDDMPDGYDTDDILPSIRSALTYEDKLYAAPFYGESAMVMYRTDLAEKAGVEIPDQPTWTDIKKAAEAMTDKSNEVYGICLRGKPGWGENMAFLTAMANSYGAAWFDKDWKAQLDSDEWKAAVNDYLDMMNEDGPPGASSNGFNENLSLFQQGKCGIWIDATVAASFVTDPDESTVADKVAFAQFPNKEGVDNHGNWLWSWNLAIPTSTDSEDAAKQFIAWATSKDYTKLVADKEGWRAAPPGTRTSLYENEEYQKAAPFAEMTLNSMQAATPDKPSVQDVPYTGGQFVAIPEFQGIGTAVGQMFSAALAGQMSADQAIQNAQQLTNREMTKAGYPK